MRANFGEKFAPSNSGKNGKAFPYIGNFTSNLGACSPSAQSWPYGMTRYPTRAASKVAKQARTPASAPGDITIRVEPLQNETLADQSLCDAITARTIAVLGQLNPGKLSVEIDTVSQDSLAAYVLKWSVQDYCAGLQVNAELLLVESETVVWSQVYCCRRSDIDALPGYLADQMVLCVWLKVISSPPSCRFTRRTEKPGAREAYLKGRYFWKQRNEEGLRKAMQCFEAAVQEDPHFALPYSGLADSLTLLSSMKLCPPLRPCPRPAGRRSRRSNSILTWPKFTPRWPISVFTLIATGKGRIWNIGEPFSAIRATLSAITGMQIL